MRKLTLLAVAFFITAAASYAQDDFYRRLADSAVALTGQPVTYDPTYRPIAYPNGDIPSDRGVCTDVVIRAYRMLGLDLQKLVHEDMVEHFGLYPDDWDLGAGIKHIGIVSRRKSADGKRYQVVHNIGAGQVLEDILFDYHIIGHYRYVGC
jgi:uncharacterized protein YijF (DUF1287 family)